MIEFENIKNIKSDILRYYSKVFVVTKRFTLHRKHRKTCKKCGSKALPYNSVTNGIRYFPLETS